MEDEAMEFDANHIIVDTETLTLCRLCTEQQGKYHIGPLMQEQIKECFDIVIKTFDGLSQIICNKCQIIAGEIFQAKKNFKTKQQALLERRKKLLLKESMGKDENISSSTSALNPSSAPQPNTSQINNTSISTPPVNTGSPLLALALKENFNTLLNQQHSNRLTNNAQAVKSPPLLPTIVRNFRRRLSSKESAVSVDDQVPSVSSSERAPTPNTILTKITNKTSPPVDVPQIVIVDECIEDDKNDKSESVKDDSQSIKSSLTKSSYIWKFHCMFCDKVYSNKTQLRRHRINFHTKLMKLTYALTNPCSIQMEKINLFQKDTAAPQSWVQTKPSHKLKYSASEPFQFTTQHPVLKKDNASVKLDSSDDESTESLAQLRKMTTSITNTDKDDTVIHASTESDNKSVTFSISDSDSRGSYDTAMDNTDKQRTTKDAEVEVEVEEPPGGIIPAPKPKKKSKYALDKAEIYRIVQSCWKTAMIKKSLTAPTTKPWLTHEILSNNSVDVVWTCSKTVKVSRATMSELDKANKDHLAFLPIYNSKNRKEPVNGHLKLRKMPETSLGTASAVEKSVPRETPRIVTNTSSKEMATLTPSSEVKTKENDRVAGVDDSKSSTPFKTIMPRLMPINETTTLTQLISFASNPVTKDAELAINNKSDIDFQALIPRVVTQRPPVESTLDDKIIQFTEVVPGFFTQKAEKRVQTVNHDANKSPFKKYCKILSKNVELMSPIIVSTVSLAKADTKDKTSTGEGVARPMIKCKPTSLLMATPEKSAVNPEEQANKVGFPADSLLTGNTASSHLINKNLLNTGRGEPPPYSLNQNLCMLNPDTALPLLSQDFMLFDDENASVNKNLGSGGNVTYPDISGESLANPGHIVLSHSTIFSNLVQLLKFNNVEVTTKPLPNLSICELVRFILTIKEKSVSSEEFTSSEFLVEIGAYSTNTLLINVQDCLSMPVDIYIWSDEFQLELVRSLKKDNFLQTMKNVSSYAAPNIAKCVQRFVNILSSFICENSSA